MMTHSIIQGLAAIANPVSVTGLVYGIGFTEVAQDKIKVPSVVSVPVAMATPPLVASIFHHVQSDDPALSAIGAVAADTITAIASQGIGVIGGFLAFGGIDWLVDYVLEKLEGRRDKEYEWDGEKLYFGIAALTRLAITYALVASLTDLTH